MKLYYVIIFLQLLLLTQELHLNLRKLLSKKKENNYNYW